MIILKIIIKNLFLFFYIYIIYTSIQKIYKSVFLNLADMEFLKIYFYIFLSFYFVNFFIELF